VRGFCEPNFRPTFEALRSPPLFSLHSRSSRAIQYTGQSYPPCARLAACRHDPLQSDVLLTFIIIQPRLQPHLTSIHNHDHLLVHLCRKLQRECSLHHHARNILRRRFLRRPMPSLGLHELHKPARCIAPPYASSPQSRYSVSLLSTGLAANKNRWN
jgi:hypothetical protein